MKKLLTLFTALLWLGSMSFVQATDYYYRGNQSGWDAVLMTPSTDGYYAYFSALGYSNNGNQNNEFKIALSTDGWDYSCYYASAGFNSTDITDMNNSTNSWENESWNNAIYNSTDFYILVYYPSTTINSGSDPIICASTFLPDNSVPSAPTVEARGGWDEWADALAFTGDETSVSATKHLAAGDYSFKMIIGGGWRGNGYTYHRDFTGSENIMTDGDNMTLEADAEGDYTFTWTFATNALSITFPAEPTPVYVDVKFFAPRTEEHKWEHVYAYSWKKSRVFSDPWPGTEITSSKDSEWWYSYSVRKGANLIFTDGAGMQTNDIENITAAACYESTGIDDTEHKADEGNPIKVNLTQTCTVEYYISGTEALTGHDWDAGNADSKLDANNQITFPNLAGGTYEFKITNGTWAWALGGNDHLKGGDCASIATTEGLGNVGFKIDEPQNVTITYYPETQEICLGAVTVKADGQVEVNDIALRVSESKQIHYTKNNTEGYGASYEILSGGEFIQVYNGFVLGVKAGTATVRATIAETANYTAASDEFTVTVTASSEPSVEPIAPLSGKFIINAKGDTAIFARGNLQYQQSTDTWRCAPNQYEWMGMSNLQMGNSNYEGWVDLFCWSIGAENNYGATSDFHTATYFNKEFVDWGTLFSAEWSTLTRDELNYLLNLRPAANSKWGIAMIGDTLGMVLLPDIWEAPAVPFVAGSGSLPTTELWRDEDCIQDLAPEEIEDKGYQYRLSKENLPANKFTISEWAELETAGAVFLPFAGRRTGGPGNYVDYYEETHPNTQHQFYYENYQGTYWTSTSHNASKGQADYFYSFSYSKPGGVDHYAWGKGVIWSESGRFGQSVRLVKRIPNAWTTVREGLTEGRHYTICRDKQIVNAKGATFWSLKNRDNAGTVAYLEEETLPLEAGKPYIFQATADKLEVVFEGDAAGAPIENGALRGIFNTTLDQAAIDALASSTGSDIYMLKNNELRQANGQTGNSMGAYKAYIVYNELHPGEPTPIPGRRVKAMPMQGQVATGIENGELIHGENGVQKVLIDGQLFLMRGEKMYDATGRLVK